MIQLRNLEKSVSQGNGRLFILRQITLDIARGEFVTIMGPSGAGKSTLLAVLGMLDGEWSGEYRFLDQAVHALKPKDHDLTVAENLDIPLSYRNVKKSEREGLVADTLDRFGIVAKKDLYPRQLSGGQQQLVAVARALIHKPALILADEPTGNLHSDQGRDIMALFKQLNVAGTTVVQVTHSEENAKAGNRIVQLKDGWIVQ